MKALSAFSASSVASLCLVASSGYCCVTRWQTPPKNVPMPAKNDQNGLGNSGHKTKITESRCTNYLKYLSKSERY